MEKETHKAGAMDFTEASRRRDGEAEDQRPVRTSVILPSGLRKKMKILAVTRDVRFNTLVVEAVQDLLRKYGQ